MRVRRLLNLAENNYCIIDAFPDLDVNLFIGTRLSAINFERWLKLIKSGCLVNAIEGKRLYTEHKGSDKVLRSKQLKKSK